MLDADFLGDIGDVLALLDFDVGTHLFPEVGDCIHGISSLESMVKRFFVVGVGLGFKLSVLVWVFAEWTYRYTLAT